MSDELIDAGRIETAERTLVVAARPGLDNQYSFGRIDPEGFNRFMDHHLKRMRASIPEMDPRIEAGIVTYFRHAFLVGVIAERQRATSAPVAPGPNQEEFDVPPEELPT